MRNRGRGCSREVPIAAGRIRRCSKLPADTPPAKCYLDDQEAYSANEVAINWNAPLVFLLAGVSNAK